jgi:hypothetical protein
VTAVAILKSRAAALIAGAIVFLAIFFTLAGPSWQLANYRLMQDGGCAILWLISVGGFGWIAWRILKPRETIIPSLAGATCVALGIGMTSLAILGLGLAGLLNHAWASGIVAIGAMIGITVLYIRGKKWNVLPWLAEPAGWRFAWIAAAAVAGVVILAAFFPAGILWGDEPNGYDVLEYHLQVPREWFEAGRIIPLHYNVFSYFPFNVEMQYLLAMHLHGGSWAPWASMYLAQLMHAAMCGAAAWAVYGLSGGGKRGIAAGLLTIAVPWTGLLAPVAYNEGGTLLFGILAIGWAIRASRIREFLIAGLMAGFAAGTKLSIAPLIFVGVPIIILIGRRAAWRNLFAGSVIYILVALLALSPWLIRNWKWTGNPVFPEAMSVLGQAHFSNVQVERWREAYWPDKDHRSIGGRVSALWTQVIVDQRFGAFLIPLGCAAAILARKNRAALCLVILLLMQTAFWLCFTHLQSRFMVIAIPITALLIAQCEQITGVTLAIAVTMSCFSVTTLIQKMGRFLKMDHNTAAIIGRENLEGFRLLDTRQLKDDASVDLVGDACAFWYQIPMSRLHYKTVFDVDTSDPNQSIEQAWLAGMPKDALVWPDVDELKRFARTYYGIKAPKPEIRNPKPETRIKSK